MKMICPKYLAAAVFVASVAVGVFSTEAAAQNAEDVRRLIEEQTLAINADSQVAEAYGKRGGLYILIDEYDLAIQDFRQVLAISKNKDERAAAFSASAFRTAATATTRRLSSRSTRQSGRTAKLWRRRPTSCADTRTRRSATPRRPMLISRAPLNLDWAVGRRSGTPLTR